MLIKQIILALFSIISLIVAVGTLADAETINYSYDSMGRLIQATYSDGTVIQYSYDKMGNRLQKTILPGSPSCTYTLSQSARTFSSAGGPGSLNVTASSGSCGWQAAVHPANTGWLSIIPPGIGTGNGAVNYSVSANSTCSLRMGTMALAGHTFTVSQSGACGLTVNKTGGVPGAITSAPAGINCGSQCAFSFESGSAVTLTAETPAGSTLKSWSGCDESSGIFCKLTIDAARDVTADFAACANLPVTTHTQQGTEQFASLLEAYSNTDQSSPTKVHAVKLTENLTLDREGTYAIEGGYDCAFLNSWLGTIVSGNATISGGTVSMKNLILTGTMTVSSNGLLTTENLILQ